MFGKKHSEETKEKIRQAHLGMKKPWAKFPSTKGDKNWNWKGGIVKDIFGYVWIYQPNHPFATKHNKVRRSRLVAEKCLGRYLKPSEQIHHINGIKDDDRPENLYLFSTNSKHRQYHFNYLTECPFCHKSFLLKSNLID